MTSFAQHRKEIMKKLYHSYQDNTKSERISRETIGTLTQDYALKNYFRPFRAVIMHLGLNELS